MIYIINQTAFTVLSTELVEKSKDQPFAKFIQSTLQGSVCYSAFAKCPLITLQGDTELGINHRH
jgi:hypothetical protein